MIIGSRVQAKATPESEWEDGEVVALYDADFFFREYPSLHDLKGENNPVLIVAVKFDKPVKTATLEQFAKDFEVPVNNQTQKIYEKAIPAHHIFFVPGERIMITYDLTNSNIEYTD